MELNEFIQNILKDIIKAVDAVQHEPGGDAVCYPLNKGSNTKTDASYDHIRHRYYQQIEFDVAVTVENENKANGNAGIKILGIGANLGGSATISNSCVSRIKFHVPIALKTKSKIDTPT